MHLTDLTFEEFLRHFYALALGREGHAPSSVVRNPWRLLRGLVRLEEWAARRGSL